MLFSRYFSAFSYGFQQIKDALKSRAHLPFAEQPQSSNLKTYCDRNSDTALHRNRKTKKRKRLREREMISDSLEHILACRIYPQPVH